MAEKKTSFFLEQSFKIMITGFVIMTVGIIFFIKMQNTAFEKTAFAITVSGIGIWLFGRICIVIQRRRLRRQRELESKISSGPET